MPIDSLRGKKIAVLGLGQNNRELVFWLLRHNIVPTICDVNSQVKEVVLQSVSEEEAKLISQITEWRTGSSFLARLKDFDIVFRTPGLSYLTSEIQQAKKAGVVVSSQTELFLKLAPCRVIGVTGTKGKSTTAAMLAHLLSSNKQKQENSQIYLAGNIGLDPFAFMDRLQPSDIVVLELSSFQLQGLSVSPPVAVMTRLEVDHLDYHQSVEEYYRAKANIFSHQKSNHFIVVNVDTQAARDLIREARSQIIECASEQTIKRGVRVRKGDSGLGEAIIIDPGNPGSLEVVGEEAEARVPGIHNLTNWAAAVCVGYFIYNIEARECRRALKTFHGLPYRLQFLGRVRNRQIYNDSYSTNPSSTIAAIKSFSSPIALICGGSSKNADFSELARVIINSPVEKVFAIGQEGSKIIEAVRQASGVAGRGPKLIVCSSLSEAADQAIKLSDPSTTILFSPACASFDMFKSAADRGQQFNSLIKKYQK